MVSVIEHEDRGVVRIGDQELEGFINDARCTNCDRCRIYHDRFDAYFCAECNVWLEGACTDPGCQYCSNRPEKPL